MSARFTTEATSKAEQVALELDQAHGLSTTKTFAMALGEHFSRLCGDELPILDETQLRLIALRRAGAIDGAEFVRLQASHLQQQNS